MIRQLNLQETNHVVDYFDKMYNTEYTPGRIHGTHDTYVLLHQAGEVPDYKGLSKGSTVKLISERLGHSSMQAKSANFQIMNIVFEMVQKGLLNPAVLYEEASIIEERAEQTRRSDFVENIQTTAGVYTDIVEAIQEPVTTAITPYKGALIFLGGLAVVGGGLYAYTLYTANKL